jgi:hypothetical protein
VAAGVRYGAIKAMALATNTPPGNPASPCGMCRQFMREFCEPIMPVLLIDEEGTVGFTSMEEVCASINDGVIGELITISSFYQIRLDQAVWLKVSTPGADNHRIFIPFGLRGFRLRLFSNPLHRNTNIIPNNRISCTMGFDL